jgi:hypothetical protein
LKHAQQLKELDTRHLQQQQQLGSSFVGGTAASRAAADDAAAKGSCKVESDDSSWHNESSSDDHWEQDPSGMAGTTRLNFDTTPYEFLDYEDSEEITVSIKVPDNTKMQDVTVKWTPTRIRVDVKGHARQPVIEGTFFKPVACDGCDFHLEGTGSSRKLVLDLLKRTDGSKWPGLLTP